MTDEQIKEALEVKINALTKKANKIEQKVKSSATYKRISKKSNDAERQEMKARMKRRKRLSQIVEHLVDFPEDGNLYDYPQADYTTGGQWGSRTNIAFSLFEALKQNGYPKSKLSAEAMRNMVNEMIEKATRPFKKELDGYEKQADSFSKMSSDYDDKLTEMIEKQQKRINKKINTLEQKLGEFEEEHQNEIEVKRRKIKDTEYNAYKNLAKISKDAKEYLKQSIAQERKRDREERKQYELENKSV